MPACLAYNEQADIPARDGLEEGTQPVPNPSDALPTPTYRPARRSRRGGYLLLDVMMATCAGVLALLASVSVIMTGAATADAARQNNAAYNAARQVVENMRLRRGAKLTDGDYCASGCANGSVTAFGDVPQLTYLRSAETPTATVATWNNSKVGVKVVTVTVRWRSGRNGGLQKSRTVTALIAPKGVSL
jgi:hypothetical protein